MKGQAMAAAVLAWAVASAAPGGDPGAVWEVGRFNGVPADGRAPLDPAQYRVREAEEPVFTVRGREAFPQTLRPGQVMVVPFDGLPRAALRLTVGVNSMRREDRETGTDLRQRQLRIEVNGDEVWHRWLVDGSAVIEAWIPGFRIEGARDFLAFENRGQEPLGFDAVRIERLRPGPAFGAAFLGAEWMGSDTAAGIGANVLSLPHPQGIVGVASPPPPARAPRDWAEAVDAFRVKGRPETEWYGEKAREAEVAWLGGLRETLRRGMLPWVSTRGGFGSEPDWTVFARRHGGEVGLWVLSGRPGDPQAHWLRESVAGARIYRYGRPGEAGTWPEDEGLMVRHMADYFGRRADRVAGDIRRARYAAGRTGPGLDRAGMRVGYPTVVNDPPHQRRTARMLAETAASWWMAGGQVMAMGTSEPGGPLFPGLDGRPGEGWEAVRPLFALAEGRAERLPVNLTPVGLGAELAIGGTHWAGALTAPDLVTVIVVSGGYDQPREVDLTVPVPWTGPTRGRVGTAVLGAWRTDPITREDEEVFRDVAMAGLDERGDPARAPGPWEAEGGVPAGDGPDPAEDPAWGMVRTRLRLRGAHEIRLWPEGRPAPGPARAVRPVPPSPPLPAVRTGGFRVIQGPLPPDWRYAPLLTPDRDSGWSGATGGGHGHVRREATRDALPAWAAGDAARHRQTVEVRSVPPWFATSDVVRLDPGAPAQGVRMFWNSMELARAEAVILTVRARAEAAGSGTAGPSRTARSLSAPVRFRAGSLRNQARIEIPQGAWVQVAIPADLFRSADAAWLMLYPDPDENRLVELELNGVLGAGRITFDRKRVGPSLAAVADLPDGGGARMLLAAPAGDAAAHLVRWERPMRIGEARVVYPGGVRGTKIDFRDAAQIMQVEVPAMPAPDAEAPMPAELARLFPRTLHRVPEGYGVMVIEIGLER